MSSRSLLESPVKDRVTIDIKDTVIEHRNIIPDLLAVHALSGCDTIACYFGIGKGTMLKHLKHRIHLFPHKEIPMPIWRM